MCAKAAKVGRAGGVSVGGTSMSQGIEIGSSDISVYKVDEIYMSARLTGTSSVALIPRSNLETKSVNAELP